MIRAIALALAWLACLSGCTTQPVEPDATTPATSSQQALYDLRSWRMEGRIVITTASETRQGNLYWEHDRDQDRLRVSGPFNQGTVSIIVQRNLIYINRGNGQTELSHEPDHLLRERLGFAVPLDNLRFWILGVPAPALAFERLPVGAAAGSGFRQSGWAIYAEKSNRIGSLQLPQKLRVEGAEVTLKIVADDWIIRG